MTQNDYPLVTFALFTYNQEDFIRDAVNGALEQDYSPLEIIISDDHSSDRTFEIIKSIITNYHGPHIVKINRNIKNLGLINHISHLFDISSGDVIVAAAGDDISIPTRVTQIVEIFKTTKPLLIHSSVTRIDKNGNMIDTWVPPLIKNKMSTLDAATALSLYIGATAAWNKDLYKEFDQIGYINAYEDLIFGFRALLKNSIHYINKPLVHYRVGTGISTKSIDFSLGLKKTCSDRCDRIRTDIDVYNQRLHDLNAVEKHLELSSIKEALNSGLLLQKMRVDFYKDPYNLIKHLFLRNRHLAFKAIAQELIFLKPLIKNLLKINKN